MYRSFQIQNKGFSQLQEPLQVTAFLPSLCAQLLTQDLSRGYCAYLRTATMQSHRPWQHLAAVNGLVLRPQVFFPEKWHCIFLADSHSQLPCLWDARTQRAAVQRTAHSQLLLFQTRCQRGIFFCRGLNVPGTKTKPQSLAGARKLCSHHSISQIPQTTLPLNTWRVLGGVEGGDTTKRAADQLTARIASGLCFIVRKLAGWHTSSQGKTGKKNYIWR